GIIVASRRLSMTHPRRHWSAGAMAHQMASPQAGRRFRERRLSPNEPGVHLAGLLELGEGAVPLSGTGESVAFAQGDFQAVDPFDEILGVGTGFLWTTSDLDVDGAGVRVRWTTRIVRVIGTTCPQGEPATPLEGHLLFPAHFLLALGGKLACRDNLAVLGQLGPLQGKVRPRPDLHLALAVAGQLDALPRLFPVGKPLHERAVRDEGSTRPQAVDPSGIAQLAIETHIDAGPSGHHAGNAVQEHIRPRRRRKP